MRRGRTGWTVRAGRELLLRINLAIQAGQQTPREMFTRLGLGRLTSFRSFRVYCTVKRREIADRTQGAGAADSALPAARRARYGTRGLRRIQQVSLAELDGALGLTVAAQRMLLLAEDLRVGADRLADVARLLMRVVTMPMRDDGNKRPGAPGGDGPVPERRECSNTRGVLHAEPDSGRVGS